MQEKFTAPKTKEEFLARVGEINLRGAKAVAQGLEVKIKRVAGALVTEKQFFDEVAEYHTSGKVPERFNNSNGKTA